MNKVINVRQDCKQEAIEQTHKQQAIEQGHQHHTIKQAERQQTNPQTHAQEHQGLFIPLKPNCSCNLQYFNFKCII